MSLFPMFVKLRDRLCVVVGGGDVAEAKIPGLLEAGAKVRVIAPKVTEAISAWAKDGRLDWAPRKFGPGDLSGAFVVIAATSVLGVNQDVFHEADAQGILCNAVDDPERCHFYYPAVVRRGPQDRGVEQTVAGLIQLVVRREVITRSDRRVQVESQRPGILREGLPVVEVDGARCGGGLWKLIPRRRQTAHARRFAGAGEEEIGFGKRSEIVADQLDAGA